MNNNTHTLTINYRQPILGDSIQYWEQPKEGEPRSGYELVDGTSEEVMDSLSLKRLHTPKTN